MDTLEQAIEFLRHNETPYWWVFSGNSKLGQNVKEEDLNASVELLRKSAVLWPAGNYKLECSSNKNDRSGSFKFPFTKGGPTAQTATTMQAINSNNAYGIADHVLKQIQEEARRTLLFEQMADKFGPMYELVKDLDRRVAKVEKFLAEDADGDGTPDFLDGLKKVGDIAKAGTDMKKVFDGGKLFG